MKNNEYKTITADERAIAAMTFRIPIAHIHGGEVTYGAYDDSIRHSLTKLSHLHFPIHDKYKKRLIQLGD